ncbi:MAG: hypothetical protein NT004_16490 [Bacteroidetes bacterium]|nr:hypothetical protein [Bacteroidota bacterium]
MNTKPTRQQIIIPLSLFCLIICAFAVTFITLYFPVYPGKHIRLIVLFASISQVILVSALLALAFYTLVQYFKNQQNFVNLYEKRWEEKHKFDHQIIFNRDTEERRAFDRARDRVNDLFRLIELSKEKHQKSESVLSGEKPDKYIDRVIEEREVVDIEKLKELIKQYNHIVQTQNTEKHV